MTLSITVFEYGFLSPTTSGKFCQKISNKDFDYLEILCLKQKGQTSECLKLCSWGGSKALQLRNYVGVIRTPSGLQIEVLPKTFKASANPIESSRTALLNMLQHLYSLHHIEAADASIAKQSMPLLEVFIRQFLHSVNHLVKRGLRSEYVSREHNLSYMKGKLLVSKQLRHNLINQHQFYVQTDEYLQDRPANRLIHTALNRVSGLTRSNTSQKLCRELTFAFSGVPISTDIKKDFSTMRLDRGMNHYQKPLSWVRLILEGFSPLSMQGQTTATSLLFPMETVFEAYVARTLKKQLKQPLWLKEQAAQHSLVRFGERQWFRLKPDLLVMNHKQPQFVLDTKWKLLDQNLNNGSDKFSLSQADFYQMFAYGHKYLNGSGDLVLIYPKTDQFNQPIQQSFQFSDSMKLWVLPFDISAGIPDTERLMLPKTPEFALFR